MELMTASPGVLYNVDGVFRNGPSKGKILPGFNLDTRKPLAENLKSTTAAIYSPKLTSKVGVVALLRGCWNERLTIVLCPTRDDSLVVVRSKLERKLYPAMPFLVSVTHDECGVCFLVQVVHG